MTLIQKLTEIRKLTKTIAKNKVGYNYRYVSIDEILAKVTGGMKNVRAPYKKRPAMCLTHGGSLFA